MARGHVVDVLTTTILDLERRPSARSSIDLVEGATVRYLATPVRYRWMGVTPTLPVALARLQRPDVVHVFGFRDPVTTGVAAWCRLAHVPYVFEPLGMYEPRLRKVLLKRVLDATLYRGVARGAAAVVVASQREAEAVITAGIEEAKVRVRGNGFPEPVTAGTGSDLRASLGIPDDAKVVLYVGRIAAGKGIEHLLETARELNETQLVIAGPDDRHGTSTLVRQAQLDARTQGRIHVLPVTEESPQELYPQADVFVLPSAGESFGMVAAEAAAAGTPVVISDRCGIAGFFEEGEALVVPYEGRAVVNAVRQVLSDASLRSRLSQGGLAAARRTSWDHVTDLQEEIYREVASRTAATKLSTDGS
ncbi:MAG: hypothetical protein QOE13_2422 [Gaiellaceae bacterium]|nr:hypothetical protein [Gaiellaceae bacterium]